MLFSAGVTPAFEARMRALLGASNSAAHWCCAPNGSSTPRLGLRTLLEQLKAASLAPWQAQDLPQAHAAASALLAYASHTQGRTLTHVHSVRVQRSDELIDLPATTRRNLELVQTLRGEDSPTLFSACWTPA